MREVSGTCSNSTRLHSSSACLQEQAAVRHYHGRKRTDLDAPGSLGVRLHRASAAPDIMRAVAQTRQGSSQDVGRAKCKRAALTCFSAFVDRPYLWFRSAKSCSSRPTNASKPRHATLRRSLRCTAVVCQCVFHPRRIAELARVVLFVERNQARAHLRPQRVS